MPHRMKVARVAEMRELDRRAIEELGIPQEILMENAGAAAYSVIRRERGVAGRRVAVFCGTGNNGGDGFVVARHLAAGGADVRAFLLEDEGGIGGSARQNLDILKRYPAVFTQFPGDVSHADWACGADAVVDAIFGTGLTRIVGEPQRSAIELINRRCGTCFSIDIPSGVNGDTGEVMGTAVKADHTITLGLPKVGNMLYPGAELCGKLHLSHISFPPELWSGNWMKTEVNTPPEVPPRTKDSHKGSYGRVLFIAGSAAYLGAPFFSAMAFLKAGGGLSYLAAPRSICPFLATRGSEIVMSPLEETAAGSIARGNRERLLELAQQVGMVVLGPGLSREDETQELVRDLVPRIEAPLLVDGDGLTALAGHTELLGQRKGITVLTPHPGEMSRLVNMSTADIARTRLEVVQRACSDWNAVVVLKGARSLIGLPDGTVFINTSGNPGMATAGCGDVLNGVIAGMYGMGMPVSDAVRTGVFLHGLAGDLAAGDKGEDGITAQDMLDYVPRAVREYRANADVLASTFYGTIDVL
ncbi:MAG: NAD(P)H-hydrate dehydratase [Chloroflexota bacterium]